MRGDKEIIGNEYLDTRSLRDRLDHLQADRESGLLDEDEIEELKILEESENDWPSDETMIREDKFEDYARDLAEDIGAMKDSDSWPYTCIDWEKAADELRVDYSEIEIDGYTYLYRS